MYYNPLMSFKLSMVSTFMGRPDSISIHERGRERESTLSRGPMCIKAAWNSLHLILWKIKWNVHVGGHGFVCLKTKQ
jgi:hypothetical protein